MSDKTTISFGDEAYVLDEGQFHQLVERTLEQVRENYHKLYQRRRDSRSTQITGLDPDAYPNSIETEFTF